MSLCNRELVEFYLSYKMSCKGYPTSLLKPPEDPAKTVEDGSINHDSSQVNSETGKTSKFQTPNTRMDSVKAALKDSADEFELRFKESFSDLSLQLHITAETAYQNFKSVLDELFKDGINWGRIVGLFVFGGVLCLECVEGNMSELVCRVADWMTIYLDEQIYPWIHSQGGWECFAELYGKDVAVEARRFQEKLQKWALAAVALLTGVLLGLLIAKKR